MKIPRPKIRDIVLAFIILIAWFVALNTGLFEGEDIHNNRVYYKPLVASNHSGIVTAKYMDTRNHYFRTIEFQINDSIK